MKQLTIIVILFVSAIIPAQSNYEDGMQKAYEQCGQNSPNEASNLFERIAKAEPDNWLPLYYAAQVKIINSFTEKNAEKFTAELKKAQDLINDTTAISRNNAEILVLHALLHTD